MLEVVLALALSAIVITLLGGMTAMHGRLQDRQQRDVLASQLARAVLTAMANDLRHGVASADASDSSTDTSNTSSTEVSDGGGNATNGSTNDPTAPSNSQTDSRSSSTDTSTISGSVASASLLGDSQQLQVEIQVNPLELARESEGLSLDRQVGDLASAIDSRYVAYYVRGAVSAIGASGIGANGTGNSTGEAGLVRRSVPRGMASYLAQQGGLSDWTPYEQLMAPEVVQLQLRYFDGTQWVDTWDSSQLGGMPAAVEISIQLSDEQTELPATGALSLPNSGTYRLVVHLPISAAKPASTMVSP